MGVVILLDFLYAEINVVTIVLLLLFLNNMNRKKNKNIPLDQYIYSICIVVNIFICIFDTGMWIFNGDQLALSRTMNYFMTVLYYISNPLICLLWLIYTDFKIYESKKSLLRRIRFYVIPCVISMVFSLASLFTGWLFIIDKNNNYTRGPYFGVMAICALVYLLLSCGISVHDILKNGWQENKSVNIHLVMFPIGMIVVTLIQIRFFGISIIWVCSMLAFASIYINIQNREISTDHLTGLYNRRRLDEHLQRKRNMQKNEYKLFAIMLDLDEFKSINDKYGHAIGDKALVKMAELLRQACKDSDDFIARMGGDEFLIVGERTETEEIKRLMEEISLSATAYNKQCKSDWFILPSMGYSVFQKDDTIDSFLANVDQEMYKNKQERKLLRSK